MIKSTLKKTATAFLLGFFLSSNLCLGLSLACFAGEQDGQSWQDEQAATSPAKKKKKKKKHRKRKSKKTKQKEETSQEEGSDSPDKPQ